MVETIYMKFQWNYLYDISQCEIFVLTFELLSNCWRKIRNNWTKTQLFRKLKQARLSIIIYFVPRMRFTRRRQRRKRDFEQLIHSFNTLYEIVKLLFKNLYSVL